MGLDLFCVSHLYDQNLQELVLSTRGRGAAAQQGVCSHVIMLVSDSSQ